MPGRGRRGWARTSRHMATSRQGVNSPPPASFMYMNPEVAYWASVAPGTALGRVRGINLSLPKVLMILPRGFIRGLALPLGMSTKSVREPDSSTTRGAHPCMPSTCM